MLILQRSIRTQTTVVFEQRRNACVSKVYHNILISFLLFNRHKKWWASAIVLCQERGVILSDSVFECFASAPQDKGRWEIASLLTWLPPFWGALIQHQAATYPWCLRRGKVGRRWPSLWCSHPICHPVQWDTHSSGEQSSLQAMTGFPDTSLLSLGVPKNQTQWSYTSMRENKLWPWLFSFIVLCWWCNMTNFFGIIVLHSNMPLSEIDSLQAQ